MKKLLIIVLVMFSLACTGQTTKVPNNISIGDYTKNGKVYINDTLLQDWLKFHGFGQWIDVSGGIAYDKGNVITTGVTLGNSTLTTAGTMKWNGTNFLGYNGSTWKTLDAQSATISGNNNEILMSNGSGGVSTYADFLYDNSDLIIGDYLDDTYDYLHYKKGQYGEFRAEFQSETIDAQWGVGVNMGGFTFYGYDGDAYGAHLTGTKGGVSLGYSNEYGDFGVVFNNGAYLQGSYNPAAWTDNHIVTLGFTNTTYSPKLMDVLKMQPTSIYPSSPEKGDIIYLSGHTSDEDGLYLWDGSGWMPIVVWV